MNVLLMFEFKLLTHLKRIWGAIGSATLLAIAITAVLLGSFSVGRYSGLILWLLMGATVIGVLALTMGLIATLRLKRLCAAHQKFEHGASADAQCLSGIERLRFCAFHLGFSAVFLGLERWPHCRCKVW